MNDRQTLGIILIVLGALLLLGGWTTALLVTLLGVALIVVGILILMGNLRGPTWLAVTCLVVGILVVLPAFDPVHKLVAAFLGLAITVIAILLIVVGVLKVMEKA